MDKWKELKPLVSVLIITVILFVIVFIKMEMRYQGYQLLKMRRNLSQLREEQQLKMIDLAKRQRPQFIEQLAKSDFTLRNARSGQIVLLTESRIAIDQKGN